MSEEPKKLNLRVKGRLMSASEIERTLVRLAHEIVEKSNGSADLALVGIKRRGVPLAERLGKLISGIEKREIETGVLDIQFYRDDLTTADVRPVVTPGSIGFDVNGRDVVSATQVSRPSSARTLETSRNVSWFVPACTVTRAPESAAGGRFTPTCTSPAPMVAVP